MSPPRQGLHAPATSPRPSLKLRESKGTSTSIQGRESESHWSRVPLKNCPPHPFLLCTPLSHSSAGEGTAHKLRALLSTLLFCPKLELSCCSCIPKIQHLQGPPTPTHPAFSATGLSAQVTGDPLVNRLGSSPPSLSPLAISYSIPRMPDFSGPVNPWDQ